MRYVVMWVPEPDAGWQPWMDFDSLPDAEGEAATLRRQGYPAYVERTDS